MARKNVPAEPIRTYEGAVASRITPEQMLRRTVCCCLLWENNFYEDGESQAERIKNLIPLVKPEIVAQIAVDVRSIYNLRHTPLYITRTMAALDSHKHVVADTLAQIVQRPDELAEFLAIYWEGEKTFKKSPVSGQVKRGLAKAFTKFNEYQLAKYNKPNEIKLKDVLKICHPKPLTAEQGELFRRLKDDQLAVPDTWEVALSAGKDKKETFERLLRERKLGGLALLRNLRNMTQADVDEDLIIEALSTMKTSNILPFRFISAAKYAPHLEIHLEVPMLKAVQSMEKLSGKTALLIDHSGSMQNTISAKSEITRFDAAGAVGILCRELCEDRGFRLFTFAEDCVEIAPRKGFAMLAAVKEKINPTRTKLGKAVDYIYKVFPQCERLIVITDEQSADRPCAPYDKGYIINVAGYQNGVGYDNGWVHISGWSEAVIRFIQEYEKIKTVYI